MREATKRLLNWAGEVRSGEFRIASRRVVDARDKYERAIGVSGEDESGWRDELFRAIDGLVDVHQQQGLHERRLVAILVDRTGAQPLGSGTAPVRAFMDLLGELDESLHGQLSLEVACDLWNHCAQVLAQLFMPPDIRHEKLPRAAPRDWLARLAPR